MVNTVAEAGFDAMPVEATVLDAEGTIVLVNGAWRRFAEENHGTDPDHWVGSNYFEVCERAYAEPRASEVLEGLKALLAGERDRFRAEYPCHSPEEQRWYAMDAAPFTHDGDPHLFVCHFDVTGRKLAERRASARQRRLESVLEVLSHDLRNPVQAIDGYAELVAEDLDDTELVDHIRSAAARITELTDAALAFGRTGELSSVEPLGLETLATEAWTHVSTQEATLAVEGPRTLHGDRRLLLQLFENLFRNAVEHAGPDCAVTVGALPDGFYVEDTGPGIPASVRDRALTGEFSPGDADGLGLAIVQAVVDAHGGTLRITESTGGGARFEITDVDVAPDHLPPGAGDDGFDIGSGT